MGVNISLTWVNNTKLKTKLIMGSDGEPCQILINPVDKYGYLMFMPSVFVEFERLAYSN